ncbi:MAG: response regulator [Luteibaculaceae bacterium]
MSEKGKILLVDDDQIVLALCKKLLEKYAYSVEISADPSEALEKIGSTTYALIILDINMPGISGFDLLQYIRSFGNETPIIFLSGSNVKWAREESLKIGAARFVSKDEEFDKLPAIIEEVLGVDKK